MNTSSNTVGVPTAPDLPSLDKIKAIVRHFYKSCPYPLVRRGDSFPTKYEALAARRLLAMFDGELKHCLRTIDGLWKYQRDLNLKRPIDSISILKLDWAIARVGAYIAMATLDEDAA